MPREVQQIFCERTHKRHRTAKYICCSYLQEDRIHRTEKGGDWYIYPQFLDNINHKNAPKKAKNRSKNFKLSIQNVASTGTNLWEKIWLFMLFIVPICYVRFARYCRKMYSRNLFPQGGLQLIFQCLLSEHSVLLPTFPTHVNFLLFKISVNQITGELNLHC